MMALDLHPQKMVQAINLGVLIGTVVLGAALLTSGIMTIPLLGLSSIAAIPALVGVALSDAARRRISVAAFRHFNLLLLMMGLTALFDFQVAA